MQQRNFRPHLSAKTCDDPAPKTGARDRTTIRTGMKTFIASTFASQLANDRPPGKNAGQRISVLRYTDQKIHFRRLCHQLPLQPELTQLHFIRMLKIQVPWSLLSVVHPCQCQWIEVQRVRNCQTQRMNTTIIRPEKHRLAPTTGCLTVFWYGKVHALQISNPPGGDRMCPESRSKSLHSKMWKAAQLCQPQQAVLREVLATILQ